MDKVAHRVDILQMLDVPHNQGRRERLSEYNLDAWKLCPGEGSRATDLMDVEDDEDLFEEIDLLVPAGAGDAGGASVQCPVGVGISLRLSVNSGSLEDYELFIGIL
ncbi:hypothetical protein HDU80_001012 [Chytriomyces hyalinus]|nr:hypothetical protein HDU80_001012 [Chytriomyces hyalinus]